ncbi:MAG: hypothetical protein IKL33_02740 [Alphaproteobacteria bacterium]|nr:hypothetical protein [Alphaproteobacteria bacterium]
MSEEQQLTSVGLYLEQLAENITEYEATYLLFSELRDINFGATLRKNIADVFYFLQPEIKLFWLKNNDLVAVYKKNTRDTLLSCLVKIRFLLTEDKKLNETGDLFAAGVAKKYDMPEQKDILEDDIKKAKLVAVSELPTNAKGQSANSVFNSTGKKYQKALTPDVLSKIQKILLVTDFSAFIRRQSVCAIIGKSRPQRVFDEVYVSIPDLREVLMPDVDLASNPWLFLSLSETLDRRVLQTISRHDDSSLLGNFSMNINVSTILSDDFLTFDDNINVSMRSSIILELQLMDIFSDMRAFNLAKTFAQARGYKICVDGVTVDKLKYIKRSELNCDLYKVIWHPSFVDVINEDEHFMDYNNKSERAKMILCRIDDEKAIEVGNSFGINLYQGRYVQRLLGIGRR